MTIGSGHLQKVESILAIQVRVRKLIAVAAQAAVAARIAATISLNPLPRIAEHLFEDALLLQLRHQSGAAGYVIVQHDCGLARFAATRNRHVQVSIRDVQCLRRAK